MEADQLATEPLAPPLGQSCGTCLFFNKLGKSNCRRNPPIVLFAGNTAKLATDYRSVWPIVTVDDWCGEWKAA